MHKQNQCIEEYLRTLHTCRPTGIDQIQDLRCKRCKLRMQPSQNIYCVRVLLVLMSSEIDKKCLFNQISLR